MKNNLIYMKMGIKTDKEILNLGYGKYTPKWLKEYSNGAYDWNYGYWVSKDLPGYDTAEIFDNGEEIYYKFGWDKYIIRFINLIYYNILFLIKYGITYNEAINTRWFIK